MVCHRPRGFCSSCFYLFHNRLGRSRLLRSGCGMHLLVFSGRNPLTSNPSLPFVGWMLLAHLFIPKAPYGSLAAKGRNDPDGGWYIPDAIFIVAWIVMAVSYSYSGYTKLTSPSWIDGTSFREVLQNPLARDTFVRKLVLSFPDFAIKAMSWGALGLELLFVPLVIFRRLRPWVWLVTLFMHFGLIVLIDFADLSLGMVMIHLFTFDPRWLSPKKAESSEKVFYDGACGLCHNSVRFLISRR